MQVGPREIRRGFICATATVAAVVTDTSQLPPDQRFWFSGPYGWVLEDVVQILPPVDCRGYQGAWTLPDDVERLVHACGSKAIGERASA